MIGWRLIGNCSHSSFKFEILKTGMNVSSILKMETHFEIVFKDEALEERVEKQMLRKAEACFNKMMKAVEIFVPPMLESADWEDESTEEKEFLLHLNSGRPPESFSGYIWLELIETQVISRVKHFSPDFQMISGLATLYCDKLGQSQRAGRERLIDVLEEEFLGQDISWAKRVILEEK